MSGEDQPRAAGGGRAFRALAIIGAVTLAVAALRLAEPVLLPLVLGLFLAVLAHPLYARLRRTLPRGLRWLAVIVTMLLLLAVLGAFSAAIGWSGRAIAQELRDRRPQIEERLAPLRGPAARVGIEIPGGSRRGAPGGNASDSAATQGRQGSAQAGTQRQDAGGGQGSLPGRVLRSATSMLGTIGLALAFAALGLLETGEARRRIAHLRAGPRALEAIDEAGPAFRRYVWVKSLTSAITGLATWLAALAFGLPLAWVWGFIAFLLEYVPTVGSLLAVVPPTLMALADGGPQRALVVLLVIGGLQVLLGNFLDPRLEGRLMAVSPFGVLLSVVFWGWLWGAIGALLAVPLTVAVVIACRHIPRMQGVATIVAGDGVPDAKDG